MPKPKAENAAKLRASLSRLYEIFAAIAVTADESAKSRCPYKNAQAQCTATFACQNQFFHARKGALPICTGSDKLNYFPAWQATARKKALTSNKSCRL